MHFEVDQIDHVELVVPDRYAAAAWYQRVLGLTIIPEFEFWAEDPRGPLMIGTRSAGTKLALFEGESRGAEKGVGFHLVAFRVPGDRMLQFVEHAEALGLLDPHGRPVTAESLVDHEQAFSIYFCDPGRNQLELTTYDVQTVRGALTIPND